MKRRPTGKQAGQATQRRRQEVLQMQTDAKERTRARGDHHTNRIREDPQRPAQPSVWRELRSLIIKIALIAGIAALTLTFMYGFHYNVDPGMNPAVKNGDLVMFYRWDKRYRAGDLLLVTFQGKDQVRRVIATAGDTVDITEDGLAINGALQQEPGITQKTQRFTEGIEFPITLGEDEVFVMGDARETATDSRIYGAVSTTDSQGKVITILRRRSL